MNTSEVQVRAENATLKEKLDNLYIELGEKATLNIALRSENESLKTKVGTVTAAYQSLKVKYELLYQKSDVFMEGLLDHIREARNNDEELLRRMMERVEGRRIVDEGKVQMVMDIQQRAQDMGLEIQAATSYSADQDLATLSAPSALEAPPSQQVDSIAEILPGTSSSSANLANLDEPPPYTHTREREPARYAVDGALINSREKDAVKNSTHLPVAGTRSISAPYGLGSKDMTPEQKSHTRKHGGPVLTLSERYLPRSTGAASGHGGLNVAGTGGKKVGAAGEKRTKSRERFR